MPNASFWDVWDKVPFGFTEWTHHVQDIVPDTQFAEVAGSGADFVLVFDPI